MHTPKIKPTIELGRPRTSEKHQPSLSPHPRSPGIHFIRQVKTRFDQQYPRIPFGPNHKRVNYVLNPFQPKIKPGTYVEADPKARVLSQQKALRHKEGLIFISVANNGPAAIQLKRKSQK